MSDSATVSPESLAKWEHLRAKSIKALRVGYSTGAISRAYEVPPRIVRQWRNDAKIPAKISGGKCRPTPVVGQELV